MSRWRVACDACDAGGWIGPGSAGPGGTRARDAWCEGCQSRHVLAPGTRAVCARCGTPLTVDAPRFEELLGEAQNLAAVLAAWCGNPESLAALLPDRPRLLTDLDPPEPRPADSSAARSGLESLAHGRFARARSSLARAVRQKGAGGHLWRALGVAARRSGDTALAETSFAHAIESDPDDSAAHLDRGALRAERGDFAGAREDFRLAGNRQEARWNRAAIALIEAVATTPGLPSADVLRRAREEAGEPSPYWSDHTIGRLLWTLLLDRASARARAGEPAAGDEAVMRAAVGELEFETFWDRSLVVHGFARLGMRADAGVAAASLAAPMLQALAAEPYALGPAGAWLTRLLARAREAVSGSRPGDALAALRSILERPDVQRYRVPCLACGRGSIGVDRVEEEETTAV